MRIRTILSLLAVLGVILGTGPLKATAAVTPFLTPVRVSTDPFSVPVIGQHKTEVEAATFSHGTTIVSAFQEGRASDGGSASIGWGTSTNSGASFSHGSLPGITTNDNPPGMYTRSTASAVGYDAKHGRWLIVSIADVGDVETAVLVSSSSNGRSWNLPVTVFSAANNESPDKPWVACDNHPASPFFGHCYIEYDNYNLFDLLEMSTSTDGGNTWSAPIEPAGNPNGFGAIPVIQPTGVVIVPLGDPSGANVLAYQSTDGGNSWTAPVEVSPQSFAANPGGLRDLGLISADIDANGMVYVVWPDCRFETGCSANDLVMTTSTDGVTWSPVTQIPITAIGAGDDYFLPGIGVDPATASPNVHLGLIYYYYPNVNCNPATCQLDLGFISSTDGGASWSTPTQPLAPAMNLAWLATTAQGPMVTDYQTASFINGKAVPVVPYALAPHGSILNEAMYSGSFAVSEGGRTGTRWQTGTPLPRGAPNTGRKSDG